MKTLIFKSILILGIVLGIVNYMLYLHTGKMMIGELANIDISSVLPSKSELSIMANDIPADIVSTFEGVVDDQQAVYKWTDANGKIHYSSEPPDNTLITETVVIDPNQNIVKRIETQPKEERAAGEPSVSVEPTALDIQTYKPETIETLIKDAKEVQTLMNERTQRLEEAAN